MSMLGSGLSQSKFSGNSSAYGSYTTRPTSSLSPLRSSLLPQAKASDFLSQSSQSHSRFESRPKFSSLADSYKQQVKVASPVRQFPGKPSVLSQAGPSRPVIPVGHTNGMSASGTMQSSANLDNIRSSLSAISSELQRLDFSASRQNGSPRTSRLPTTSAGEMERMQGGRGRSNSMVSSSLELGEVKSQLQQLQSAVSDLTARVSALEQQSR